GHRVKILDAFALGMNWGEFEEEVKKQKPELIGLGGMTPTIDNTLRAIRACRPHTRTVVVGGPHVSVLQQEFFRECPEADFGVVGEGEKAFAGLARRLEEGKDPWEVPGVVGPEKANPPGDFIEDLDSLPFPSRHLLPNQAYRYALWPGKKITTLITSRGCPYHCIFCDKSVFGSRWRPRSPENVLDEMEQVVKDFKIRSMILYDDLFTLNKQRVMELCLGILERGLRIEWKCEGRVDRVDEEMLGGMKKAGCTLIAYGVESGNQEGLDYLRKKTTLSQIRRAFALTRKAGIRPMAYFILGIPVETFEGGLRTIEFAKELKPEYAQFSILSPYKGTDLYEEAKSKGWYGEVEANNPFDKDRKRPVLLSENWTEETLQEILKEAHRRFYFRGGYILNRLRGARSLRGIRSLGGVGWGLLRWYFSRGGAK
ncbi:MAG: B12-binding domain-containing radical SAM protein, partial [Planctomycetaceae bacterium]